KRFTYKEAKAVLDGKKQSKFKSSLELMVELCGHLKRKRYERGSIEFSLPELVVIVDEKGVPQKTDYIEYDITHQLIEEFMLKANEVVATHLS
ncbi:RNB domain-containing ribonuclease, partial [Salmonella enterica subsp. enterica serovar Typhimurium]|nr:RNB domain-containing ribonuclease [Salmonella enterica subsp. enterica serovar Typhimurium]